MNVKLCYNLCFFFSVDRKLEQVLPFGKDVNIADPVKQMTDVART